MRHERGERSAFSRFAAALPAQSRSHVRRPARGYARPTLEPRQHAGRSTTRSFAPTLAPLRRPNPSYTARPHGKRGRRTPPATAKPEVPWPPSVHDNPRGPKRPEQQSGNRRGDVRSRKPEPSHPGSSRKNRWGAPWAAIPYHHVNIQPPFRSPVEGKRKSCENHLPRRPSSQRGGDATPSWIRAPSHVIWDSGCDRESAAARAESKRALRSPSSSLPVIGAHFRLCRPEVSHGYRSVDAPPHSQRLRRRILYVRSLSLFRLFHFYFLRLRWLVVSPPSSVFFTLLWFPCPRSASVPRERDPLGARRPGPGQTARGIRTRPDMAEPQSDRAHGVWPVCGDGQSPRIARFRHQGISQFSGDACQPPVNINPPAGGRSAARDPVRPQPALSPR